MKHYSKKSCDGFALIFFVIIMGAMLIALVVNTAWLNGLVRNRLVADIHHYEAAITARSCIERFFFWSENNLTPNITGCKLMSYNEINNIKTAKVQVSDKNYYVQEIYSVAR